MIDDYGLPPDDPNVCGDDDYIHENENVVYGLTGIPPYDAVYDHDAELLPPDPVHAAAVNPHKHPLYDNTPMAPEDFWTLLEYKPRSRNLMNQFVAWLEMDPDIWHETFWRELIMDQTTGPEFRRLPDGTIEATAFKMMDWLRINDGIVPVIKITPTEPLIFENVRHMYEWMFRLWFLRQVPDVKPPLNARKLSPTFGPELVQSAENPPPSSERIREG